jgi:hypothetical protein
LYEQCFTQERLSVRGPGSLSPHLDIYSLCGPAGCLPVQKDYPYHFDIYDTHFRKRENEKGKGEEKCLSVIGCLLSAVIHDLLNYC